MLFNNENTGFWGSQEVEKVIRQKGFFVKIFDPKGISRNSRVKPITKRQSKTLEINYNTKA